MMQSFTFTQAGVVVAACLLHCSARQEEAPAPAPAALANYAFPGHNLRPLKGLPPCFNGIPALHIIPHALVHCNSDAHGTIYIVRPVLVITGINYAPTPSDFTSYGQGGAALLLWRQKSPSLSQCPRLWPCSDTALPETLMLAISSALQIAGELP